MKKIDKTIIRETLIIAAGSAVLSAVMNAVFLIIGKWDITVLLGTLLGLIVSVGNFFLMGLTIQSSIGKDEKAIKTRVQFSLIFRLMLMFAVAVGAYFLPKVFNIIPLLISFFFPRIVILFRGFIKTKEETPQGENSHDENGFDDETGSSDDSGDSDGTDM